jgi:hypothetical protein
MNSQRMDPSNLKLLGLHRAEFRLAEKNQNYSWAAQGVVTVVAFVSIFTVDERLAYLVAVLALLFTAIGWYFGWRARTRKQVADRARRALLLMEGLGWKMSGKEKTDLLSSLESSETEAKLWEDEDFFHNAEKTGTLSLARKLEESVFWSKHLLALSARRLLVFSLTALFVCTLVLLAIPLLPSQQPSILIARLVCVALTTIVTADLFGMSFAQSEAARNVASIDDRLVAVIASGCPEPDLFYIFGDYNAAVESVPVIPYGIYKRSHDRLNGLWESRAKE